MTCQFTNGDFLPLWYDGIHVRRGHIHLRELRQEVRDGVIQSLSALADEEDVDGEEFGNTAETIHGVFVDMLSSDGAVPRGFVGVMELVDQSVLPRAEHAD